MYKRISNLNQKASLAAWKAVRKAERGQTLSEYAVIIGVIVGVVVVGVVIGLRGQIVASFQAGTNALKSAR